MLQKKFVPEIISKLALFTWKPKENAWSWDRDLPMSEAEKSAIRYI